jgi:LuxR family maltose regulon positive regulatory protein
MSTPILTTKLYIPPPRPNRVRRPRLIGRVDEGLHGKITLVSAPAGFGKTTLVAEWIVTSRRPVAWLSLDEEDNDPIRFLAYLITALQRVAPATGEEVLRMLYAPQPPSLESILARLVNEIAAIPDEFVLVLDDYHVIDAGAVDQALNFLIDHLPPRLHLVIATRQDPSIPLARLRARGQLTEIRAGDLRFTAAEAADFLKRTMSLDLSPNEINALEKRTEGWIAGLQLAAISMQGNPDDAAGFIQSFTGSHRFVMDYLIEEVLHQQPASMQIFLLRTSILERMCAPLCDAVVRDPATPGAEALAFLERANLFLTPLDNERRWYRYHHLFADLLQQRLVHHLERVDDEHNIAEYHQRASQWFEENGLEIEAFHHATAAHDIERAIHLIEAQRMPLHFRGGAVPILNWLKSLPTSVLDANPVLWVTYASALLIKGQVIGVEEKARAAEVALQKIAPNHQTEDLIGRIASIRATVAVTQHNVEGILLQSQRALAYLRPDNLPARASIHWTLAYAYFLRGERSAAAAAYTQALADCQAVGHKIIAMMATIGLGMVQEQQTRLHLAQATYQSAVTLIGDAATPPICDAYLGMARICYEWNDLDGAQMYAQKSLDLARQIEKTDRSVVCEVFLARLKLTQGDVAGAAALLTQAEEFAHRHHYEQRLPDVVSAQVLTLLRQGKLSAAARLAESYDLPLSRARVYLARQDPMAALALLAHRRAEVEAKEWNDERLKVMILQAIAHKANGDEDQAMLVLADALALTEADGFIRLFIDEGEAMVQLLSRSRIHGIFPTYTAKILAALPPSRSVSSAQLIDPLSERELEILHLIADGLKNQEIADQLIISLNTVLYHIKNIYSKLGVNKRALAINKARALELI